MSTARRKRAVDGGLTCWCSMFRGAAPSTQPPPFVASAVPYSRHLGSSLASWQTVVLSVCYWIGHGEPATKSLRRRRRRERNTQQGQKLLYRLVHMLQYVLNVHSFGNRSELSPWYFIVRTKTKLRLKKQTKNFKNDQQADTKEGKSTWNKTQIHKTASNCWRSPQDFEHTAPVDVFSALFSSM